MEQLTITVPAWAIEQDEIYIIAGGRVAAMKRGDGPWLTTVVGCVRCGICCAEDNWGMEWADSNGRCQYLDLEDVGGSVLHRCAHPDKPWSCVKGHGDDDRCEMRFEVI